MPASYPPLNVAITTPLLTLAGATDDLLEQLTPVVRAGVVADDEAPFDDPMTLYLDGPDREWRWRRTIWTGRGQVDEHRWRLYFVVLVDGSPAGMQDLIGTGFAQFGTVSTFSWLAPSYRGRGLGSEMRAAVLHLAFAGLGAREAASDAFTDNHASNAVSRALGYEPNGTDWATRRGVPAPLNRWRLTRQRWEQARRADIRLAGVGECLPVLGISQPESPLVPGAGTGDSTELVNGAERRLPVPGSDGEKSQASLLADVVYRDPGPQSPAVLALLRHLEDAGFAGAPKVVGTGIAADGREMVRYIEGSSPHPRPWPDDAVGGVGRLLAGLHAAAATFVPPPGAVWKPWFGRALPGSRPVFGHCDTGPWNIVARDGQPVALIDFEFAGPVDAIWDLVQAAWLNAQLHDDDIAERSGLPDAAARARQVRLVLDGYELPRGERDDFVDKMISFAVHDARAEAVSAGVTPDVVSATTSDGYPYAWAITWRARSASWMLTNRSLLQRALA